MRYASSTSTSSTTRQHRSRCSRCTRHHNRRFPIPHTCTSRIMSLSSSTPSAPIPSASVKLLPLWLKTRIKELSCAHHGHHHRIETKHHLLLHHHLLLL